MEKDGSKRETSKELLESVRGRINEDLTRKINKNELLEKKELRSKIVPNMAEKLLKTLNEYDKLKQAKDTNSKNEKQIAELISLIGSFEHSENCTKICFKMQLAIIILLHRMGVYAHGRV